MTAVADPVGAFLAILAADSTVAGLVGSRLFGIELDPAESPSMPRRALVAKPAGGGNLNPGYGRWGDTRIDLRCYGATPLEAHDLFLAVHPVLKQQRRSVHAGCLVHWIRPAGGPVPMRDIDADWPFTFSSWQVMASEVPL